MLPSKIASRRRRWLPRFSLAGLFVLVTLSAVGVWYRYQVPFNVENVELATARAASPAALGVSLPPAGEKAVRRREVQSVRRVLSRDRETIPHGPRKVYGEVGELRETGYFQNGVKHGRFTEYFASGQLRLEEFFGYGKRHGTCRAWNAAGDLVEETNYERDVLHGRYFRANLAGQPEFDGAYEHGLPTGKWTWSPAVSRYVRDRGENGTIVADWRAGKADGRWVCQDGNNQVYLQATFDNGRLIDAEPDNWDTRLTELLAQGKLTDRKLIPKLFGLVDADLVSTPLEAAVQFLGDVSETPIICGIRGSSMTLTMRRDLSQLPKSKWSEPLICVLGKSLSPHGLVCDYRYGVLWVDWADAAAIWRDPTGITGLQPSSGSRLARLWDDVPQTGTYFEQTPFANCLQFLEDGHSLGLRFDSSALSAQTKNLPVTLSIRGIPFRHQLGLLLDQVPCQASLRGETIVLKPRTAR